MNILGRTQMIEKETLPDRIAAVGALGFDGAEVCLEKKDWEVYELTEKMADEVKIAAAQAGYAWYSMDSGPKLGDGRGHFSRPRIARIVPAGMFRWRRQSP